MPYAVCTWLSYDGGAKYFSSLIKADAAAEHVQVAIVAQPTLQFTNGLTCRWGGMQRCMRVLCSDSRLGVVMVLANRTGQTNQVAKCVLHQNPDQQRQQSNQGGSVLQWLTPSAITSVQSDALCKKPSRAFEVEQTE